jgi:hypothetical protein
MADVDRRVFRILLAMGILSIVLIAIDILSLGYGLLNLSIAIVLFWLFWWRHACERCILWAILDEMAEKNADVTRIPKPRPISLLFARLAARITRVNLNWPGP